MVCSFDRRGGDVRNLGLGLLVAAALAAGCGHSSSAGAGGSGASGALDTAEQVHAQSATVLSCPADQLVFADESGGSIRASGCGKEIIWSWDEAKRLWFSDLAVRNRAPSDLQCYDEPLGVVYTGPATREVSGCGVSARYEMTGAGWVRR
jgi:hypothetical protein